MTNGSTTKIPVWFWIVAGLALVWNLMGVAAFVGQMTMSAEALAALPTAEREMLEGLPFWAVGAFGLAVCGGALGSLLLLLRKSLAFPVLIASLAGVLVQMFNAFVLNNGLDIFGPGRAVMPAMIVVIAVCLVWFANMAKGRGLLS